MKRKKTKKILIKDLQLSYTETWHNRSLEIESPEWKEIRKKIIERDKWKCSFCQISLKKYLVVDHIDGDATNNDLKNLRTNCPACDKIRHCGLAGINNEIEVWNSKLTQVEIVQRTNDFVYENERIPHPKEIDVDAEETNLGAFEVAFDRAQGSDRFSEARGFFTEEMNFQYLNYRIFEDNQIEKTEKEKIEIFEKISDEQNFLLKDLNKEQRLAAICKNEKICVIAGPGCGKTRTLIARITLLVERGIKPKNILVLSFSRKAIQEIKSRVKKNSLRKSKGIKINNLHGFCYFFLLENSEPFKICDQNEQKRIIKKALKDMGSAKNRDSKKISRICNKIAFHKIMSITSGKLDFRSMRNDEIEVAMVYQEYLKKNNMLDFSDLLLQTFTILVENKEIREKTKSRFRHILVDEFQDINNVQWSIINLIKSESSNLFLVGDPNQCIYGFQGSSPQLIKSFQKNKNWTNIHLNINYRSTKNIVELGNRFISSNKESMLDNYLKAVKKEGENPSISENTNFDRVCEKIRILEKEINYSEIAIIYRKNDLSAEIEKSLIKAQIPYEILGDFKFINREEIRDALSYLKMIINDEQIPTLRVLSMVESIGDETIKKIEKLSKKNKVSISSCIRKCFEKSEEKFPGKLQSKQIKNIKAFSSIISKKRERMKTYENVESFMKSILEDFEYYKEIEGEEDRILNVEKLFNMLKDWESKNFLQEKDIGKKANKFLNYLSISFEDINLKKTKSNVIVSSVHKVKGLEFKVVFFVYLDDGVIPHERSNEEERRIFYVGITRAKDFLYLSSSKYENEFSEFLKPLNLEKTNEFQGENEKEIEIILQSVEEIEEKNLEIKSTKKGVVLQDAVIRKSGKSGTLYSMVFVLTKEGKEKVFFWKSRLKFETWNLSTKLKVKDLISYEGEKWDGGFNARSLRKIKEKNVWPSIEKNTKNFRMAFLDIETTSSRKVENEIIEIGYLVYELGREAFLKKSFFVRPKNIKKLEEANIYNNIKMSELRKAKEIKEILPEIQKDLENSIIVSHNFKSFDYHHLKKIGFFKDELTYYFFDTIQKGKELVKEEDWHGGWGLENLIRKIRKDETFQEEHRALPDALLHKELFDYLVKGLEKIELLYRVH